MVRVTVTQFLQRNNHVWPPCHDSQVIKMPLANFPHIFSLVDGDVGEVFVVQGVIHGPDSEANEDEGDAADNNAEDVEGELGGVAGVAFQEGGGRV